MVNCLLSIGVLKISLATLTVTWNLLLETTGGDEELRALATQGNHPLGRE